MRVISLEDVRTFLESVVSIFAIVNPIGGLPLFLALTEDLTVPERRHLFRLAGVISLAIICVMAVAGRYLVTVVFHISFAEFMFGGGLILIVIGVLALVEKPETRRERVAMDPQERKLQEIRLAVSPIASPLLVGPGSIVTVMLIVARQSEAMHSTFYGMLYGLAACLVAFAFVILILNYAGVAFRLMGTVGSIAVGRVMEIFIVALGANFVFTAIKDAFPALNK
jgi:multiple antibiotic resistance protein